MKTINSLKELSQKNIALVGFGEENQSLGSFLVKNKIPFAVFDEKLKKIPPGFKKIKFVLGKNAFNSLKKEAKNFDLVLRTPGIAPEKLKFIKPIKLSSPTELFFKLCPAKIIGVTGTKGKGTTASLIAHILRNSRISKTAKIWLGGNIGKPVFDFLEEVKVDDLVVLELSSFQLLGLKASPYIGVVLNITSDHLDYHQKISDYAKAKYAIVGYQTKNDFAVINADYLTSFKFAERTPGRVFWFSIKKRVAPGVFVRREKEGGKLIFSEDQKEERILNIPSDFQLAGPHNLENLAGAVAVAKILGARNEEIKKAVRTFKGLPHRLEFLRNVSGIRFYNDSYSTNPDSTIAALRSFIDPCNLIVGGRSKGLAFDELAEVILKRKVKRVFLLGENGPEILQVLKKISKKIQKKLPAIFQVKTLREAVALAYKEALAGEIVLFSPASASFDMFKNAAQRGEVFKKLVKKLK